MISIAQSSLTDVTAFVDPASGKTALRRTASRSADVVVAQDELGRVFVLHAWAGRIPTTAHTDRLFRMVEDFRPRIVGIDASAMQSLWADALMREAKQRALRLPLHPMKMPTSVDKLARIRTILQPVIAAGRLFIQAGQRDLFQELEAFPSGLTVDLADALAEATTLLRKVGAKRSADGELDARLRYLKESNSPAWYIAEVAKGIA